MPSSLLNSGGKKWSARIDGVQEWRAQALALQGTLKGDQKVNATLSVQAVMDAAASYAKEQVINEAAATGLVPSRIVSAVFQYGQPGKGPRQTVGALAGVNKGAPPRLNTSLFRSWRKGTRSESLVTMFERGVKKNGRFVIPASRYYRRGMDNARTGIFAIVEAGYKAIMDAFNSKVP